MNTRYIVDYDTDAQFEECDGGNRPLSEEAYAENYYNDKAGNRVSYADYLAYYGNPDRHVYLFVRREDQCPCCDSWIAGGAIYNIDFMDDNPESYQVGTWPLDKLTGYLREVALELEPATLKVP